MTQRRKRGAPTVADGIGVTLARAREAAGLTIAQLGQQTNIPSGFIKALEQGYLSTPGGEDADRTSFTPGVIRELAKAVGLDPEPLVQEYKESGGGRRLKHASNLQDPLPDLRDPPDDPEADAEHASDAVWTINQVVAYNLQAARRAQQWPQDYLAHQLVNYTNRPWSNATVSAAERSWESGRIRRFDANELLAFSRIFNLPVIYFFLPPDHADESFAYIAGTPGSSDEYEKGSYTSLRPQDLLETIVPFSFPAELTERLKAAHENIGEVYRQPEIVPEGLDPEVELIVVEGQLKAARAWLVDLVNQQTEVQERINELADRSERLRRRISRREQPLSKLLPNLKETFEEQGREKFEKDLALLSQQLSPEYLLKYGWPRNFEGDIEAELNAVAEVWPDLEETCDDLIDTFRRLEKWWTKEGGRNRYDKHLREVVEKIFRVRTTKERSVGAGEENPNDEPV